MRTWLHGIIYIIHVFTAFEWVSTSPAAASSCCINARMFAVTHYGLSHFFLCRFGNFQAHSGSVCTILHTEPTCSNLMRSTNLIWGTQTSFAERSFKKGHWKAPMAAVKVTTRSDTTLWQTSDKDQTKPNTTQDIPGYELCYLKLISSLVRESGIQVWIPHIPVIEVWRTCV